MLHKADVPKALRRIEGKDATVNVTHLVIIKSLLPTRYTNMVRHAINMIKAAKYKTIIWLHLMLNGLQTKPMKLPLQFNDLQEKKQN